MFKPFTTTGVGSMPHKDIDNVLKLIFDNIDIPFWPQLPKKSVNETMYIQYSNSLPCISIDEKNNLNLDRQCFDLNIEEFYNNYLSENYDFFKLTSEYASALDGFLDKAKDYKYVKVQITGPVSYGLSLTLIQDNKPALYDDIVMDIIVKNIIAKAKWFIRYIKSKLPNLYKVILFLDEPFLASLGSGYINISRSQVIAYFEEIITELKKEDFILGVHCCGNTDWQTLLELNLDIINFDAYNYIEKFILYSKGIKDFLLKGGYIAWGLVPTIAKDLKVANVENLISIYDKGYKALIADLPDKDLITSKSLLTPSCGFSNVDIDLSKKGIYLLKDLKLKLKEVYLK